MSEKAKNGGRPTMVIVTSTKQGRKPVGWGEVASSS